VLNRLRPAVFFSSVETSFYSKNRHIFELHKYDVSIHVTIVTLPQCIFRHMKPITLWLQLGSRVAYVAAVTLWIGRHDGSMYEGP
jgi:hypothetical protein